MKLGVFRGQKAVNTVIILEMSEIKPQKILICRSDKIGDVILTFPVITALRKTFPEAHIGYLCREYTRKVLEGNPGLDELVIFDPEAHKGLRGILALSRLIKSKNYDTALMLYPRPGIALALFLAGVKERIGTAYRWYSFLFNRKVSLHRKNSLKHELEYNLDLLAPLSADTSSKEIRLFLSEAEKKEGREFLEKHGLAGKSIISIHPGSAVSVLNWPIEKYRGLTESLIKNGTYSVLLVEGKGEERLTGKILDGLAVKPAVLPGTADIRQVAAVLAGVSLHISSNTGTMHLAAAVGTRTLSFFNPTKAVSPARWGAWGNSGVSILPGQAECVKCIPECPAFNCMDRISVDEVLRKITSILGAGRKAS